MLLAIWVCSGNPKDPLLTLTRGIVPSTELIVPTRSVPNPTSSTFIYSLLIFNTSLGWTELIPLKENCERPIPIVAGRLWLIEVYVIGCWMIPSSPITVLLNLFVISSLWALPWPELVNVIGIASSALTYSLLLNNWILSGSNALTYTVDGIVVWTNPLLSIVAAIPTATGATPINVEASLYVISSLSLKKWFGIVNVVPLPTVVETVFGSAGLNLLK